MTAWCRHPILDSSILILKLNPLRMPSSNSSCTRACKVGPWNRNGSTRTGQLDAAADGIEQPEVLLRFERREGSGDRRLRRVESVSKPFFHVIEFWLENRLMIEVAPLDMAQEYEDSLKERPHRGDEQSRVGAADAGGGYQRAGPTKHITESGKLAKGLQAAASTIAVDSRGRRRAAGRRRPTCRSPLGQASPAQPFDIEFEELGRKWTGNSAPSVDRQFRVKSKHPGELRTCLDEATGMCIGDDLNSYRLDDTWLALQGALGPFNRLVKTPGR
jgi:hypothetical protein